MQTASRPRAIATAEELDLTAGRRSAVYGDDVRRLPGPWLTP
ncbi:hypothetical protein ABZ092_01010 [Streptomyces bobili]